MPLPVLRAYGVQRSLLDQGPVESYALRTVEEALRKDLKSLEFDIKPKGAFGIGISMKLQPSAPLALRRYREKALETAVHCEACTLDYMVYGVFAFCPDCGVHNSLLILRKNLDLVRKQMDLAQKQEDVELARHLREDALENCVSSFDAFARESVRVRAARSCDPEKAVNVSFQNIARALERVNVLFSVDLAAGFPADDLAFLKLCFLRRHLIAHKAGVVDAQYVEESGDRTLAHGRRISIDPADVVRCADLLGRLGAHVLDALDRRT